MDYNHQLKLKSIKIFLNISQCDLMRSILVDISYILWECDIFVAITTVTVLVDEDFKLIMEVISFSKKI